MRKVIVVLLTLLLTACGGAGSKVEIPKNPAPRPPGPPSAVSPKVEGGVSSSQAAPKPLPVQKGQLSR